MLLFHPSSSHLLRQAGMIVMAALLVSCSAPVQKPTGPAADYNDAKDMFKRGRFDRAIESTDALSTASPTNDFTERARVIRAVIFTGQLKSAKELSDAYAEGADKTKNSQFKAAYLRQHHDTLLFASKAALNTAETAHQLVPDGVIAKELILEASYPTVEGPMQVTDLDRIEAGGWVEPDQQDSAAADSLRKGIDEALADAVSGDRSKARNALASGSTKIDGVDFAIFLANQLAEGAVVFDRKHGRDPMKLKTLCDEGNDTLKAALAQLKEQPDKAKEKEVKELQERFKKILKNA